MGGIPPPPFQTIKTLLKMENVKLPRSWIQTLYWFTSKNERTEQIIIWIKDTSVANNAHFDLHSGNLEGGGYGKISKEDTSSVGILRDVQFHNKVCGIDFLFLLQSFKKHDKGMEVSYQWDTTANGAFKNKTAKQILKPSKHF